MIWFALETTHRGSRYLMQRRYEGFDLFWSYPALPKMPLKFFYHRDCRFSFTHKKALDLLKCEHRETTENEVNESEKQRSSQRKTKTNDSRVYEKICIFCEKSNKYIKNSRTRETLV